MDFNEYFGQLAHGPGTNQIDLDGDVDHNAYTGLLDPGHDLDSGIFKQIFWTSEEQLIRSKEQSTRFWSRY